VSSSKVRKQVYIERDQEEMLKRWSAELGISEAEIIRQAIAGQTLRLRSRFRDVEAWRSEQEFIRSLIEQGPLPGSRRWTREEVYER
jgi:putative heme degradation protein